MGSKILIEDANIIITDRLMEKVYGEGVIDKATVTVFRDPGLFDLNLVSTREKVFSLLSPLLPKTFCICGSSNFHHLDAANISLIHDQVHSPLQLVLIDCHMDCQRFQEKSQVLHCGNWVSFCYRKRLVSRVVMIGCDDFSRLNTFDSQLREDANLLYLPDFEKADVSGFLDPAQPTYISVDTDVLDLPSDWGVGHHGLENILNSPIWEQLRRQRVVAAFLNGHVSDGRRLLDALIFSLKGSGRDLAGLGFRELVIDGLITLKDKGVASLAARPLEPALQLGIMLRFYERIREAMQASNRIRQGEPQGRAA